VDDSRNKANRTELESQRHFHALLEKPFKPPKLKQLGDKIREQYSKSQFMREYRETHDADPGYHREKADFEKKLLYRRDQLYRDYDLDKLWKDAQIIQIKDLMDFADTDIEMVKARIEGWNKEQ